MDIEHKILSIVLFAIGCIFLIVSSMQIDLGFKIADIIIGLCSVLCSAYIIAIYEQ